MPFKFFIGALVLSALAEARTEPWHGPCRQALVVLTTDWTADEGTLFVLEETGRGWATVFEPIEVTVGKNGLGWGLGLHAPRSSEPQKHEGDQRAPAGVFALESGFSTGHLRTAFPFRRTTDADRWVDDPRSVHYNRLVNTGDDAVAKDWNSAEVLRRPDGIYDFAIVVGHNRHPIVPGRGSAIFIHAWFGPGRATIGCTAMEKETVKTLLKWLDPEKAPVLVQLPRSEWEIFPLPAGLREAVSSAR